MEIDIANKGFAILGLKGTGKSVLVKSILRGNKDSMVYDVLHEHTGFNRYLPKYRDGSDAGIAELNYFVRQCIQPGNIRLFILEEANRYCPPKPKPLPPAMLDLNDFNRHWHISFGVVARRPTQLNSDLIELAHYLFIYRLVGKNDYQYLESVAEGLGDAVRGLPDYHFVVCGPDRKFQVHAPVQYKETVKE